MAAGALPDEDEPPDPDDDEPEDDESPDPEEDEPDVDDEDAAEPLSALAAAPSGLSALVAPPVLPRLSVL